jgi:hypothetical protein
MSSPPFTRPAGDPAAVLAAARRLGNASGSADDALRTFRGGTSEALAGWDSPVAVEFAQLSGPAANRMTAAVTQLEGAAGLLTGYAQALLAAQDRIDALHAQWLAQQDTLDSLGGARDPDAQQESDRSDAAGAQERIEGDARDALADLDSVARRVAGHLDDGTAALVPGAADKDPQQLYAQVLAAWAGIAPAYAEFKRGASAAGKLYSTTRNTAQAVQAVRAYAAANRAALVAHQTRNLAIAQARVLIRGGGATNRIPGQLGILARDIADARRVADTAAEVSASRYANFYRSVVPATRFAKGLAVVGVVGSMYDLFANPLNETGARRNISIGMDVVGTVAGGTALAASMGLIALGPVGVGLVAGGLAVAGAWAIGTYVYDHWDDITHGVDVATEWVADGAREAWDSTTGAVEGAVDTASDAVSDVAGGLADAVGGLF